MAARDFTTRRKVIATALANLLKQINGTLEWKSDLENRVEDRLRFWDELTEYPEVNVWAGNETREYQASVFKWRFMTVTIRVYVSSEDDPQEELAIILEDIETILEENSDLQYIDNDGAVKCLSNLEIISISTDEGVLAPLGVGELVAEIRY